MTAPVTAPLAGLRVVDFSTLLPGPLATLLLAESGAEVVKIERPGQGDEMRSYQPRLGTASANFALLNRGKLSVAADLKDPGRRDAVAELMRGADVVVEQFRPGVMDRLGLGYERISRDNPGVVYCSITGHGQHGPRADRAGHDLTYLAETGLLDLVRGADGDPPLPPVLVADIAGGAYPALFNILLALAARERTGRGSHLDVSMADNVRPLAYWALGQHRATGEWPEPSTGLVTGGSPRYRVYRTADGRHLAAAPLEERFWRRFCELIELPERFRDDAADPAATIAAVAERVALRTAADWEARFAGQDVCCAVVATLAEAFPAGGTDALPLPLAPALRPAASGRPYPALDEHAALLNGWPR
ncbi:CaiB/BaiF CoA transferase family protein [Pseudonocardia acaciae]|uniref:CaiB/BaiF CoA transferase family protein n=1 Tax=Pseudonocardia acaciae TaxID=551276 RepID=UPI000566AB40|nr:CaiB/BaiF CoA-transferase family protein [Pseudonocardia acaciae]